MDLVRYIDNDWHHYCDRRQIHTDRVVESLEELSKSKADKKYSYIQDFHKSHLCSRTDLHSSCVHDPIRVLDLCKISMAHQDPQRYDLQQ